MFPLMEFCNLVHIDFFFFPLSPLCPLFIPADEFACMRALVRVPPHPSHKHTHTHTTQMQMNYDLVAGRITAGSF